MKTASVAEDAAGTPVARADSRPQTSAWRSADSSSTVSELGPAPGRPGPAQLLNSAGFARSVGVS